jgi:threonyl-tRNA synthetase
MKLLLIHVDSIDYTAVKPAGKFAEEIPEERKTGRLEEALAVFTAIEKVDEASPQQAVAQAAAAIRDVAKQVKTERLMLYPYAHLSRDLASPNAAKTIFADLETSLTDGFTVKRSPFGWYKKFQMSCKGHPLSELSREIIPGKADVKSHSVAETSKPAAAASVAPTPAQETVSVALQKESELRSEWFILDIDGELKPAKDFDLTAHDDLRTFYQYESQKVRTSKEEAPHIRMMQELELVDYEPGSDSGNFRWYPKGQLIKRLMEAHVRDICQRHGAMQVETPIMYDIAHPALSKYLNRFPARQYRIVADDREFFLRFAACFGQYMIARDMTISYRHLPLKLLEITHYSFRREQRGELTGIKRLRAFTMPDMHTVCADMDQAKDEFQRQYDLARGWMADLKLPFEVGIRIVREFYEANKPFYKDLVKRHGRPVLVEMWKDRFFYFVTKFELNVIDAVEKAAALSTVQIDVENTERFDIQYTDSDGKRKFPLLLHASISGSIDRCLYTLLEREHLKTKQGLKPMLPFWLSPVHIRILSVKTEHVEAAVKLKTELLKSAGVELRIEIDDREEGIGRKIRDAEKSWTPIILVLGDKEAASGVHQPRLRRPELLTDAGLEESKTEFKVADIAALAAKLLKGKPTAPLALPERVSLQPTFRG